MNRLSTSLILAAVGAAGVLGGWYFASQGYSPALSTTAQGTAVAAPERRPVNAEAVGQSAEVAALRADIKELRTEIGRLSAPSKRQEQDHRHPEQARREEKARVFQEQLTTVEDTFRAEPVDPAWSRQRAGALSRLLEKYPALSGLGAEVECRSARCRVILPSGAGEGSDEALMAFVQDAQEDFAQVDIFPGGTGADAGQTVLHLSPAAPPDPDVDPALQPRMTMVDIHNRE
jgi:hypothetical protein